MTIKLCAYRGCVNHATDRDPDADVGHSMSFCKDHWEILDALTFDITREIDDPDPEDIQRLDEFWNRARGMIA